MNYMSLCSVTIFHNYFGEKRNNCFTFAPTRETAKLFDSYGLFFRQNQNSVFIVGDIDQINRVTTSSTSDISVGFTVMTNHRDYHNFTDPDDLYAQYLNSDGAELIKTDSPHKVSSRIRSVLSFTIILSIKELINNSGLEIPHYTIPVSSRKTFWKYLINNATSSSTFSITDQNDEFHFTDDKMVHINNREFHAVTSQDIIPLTETPNLHFTLKDSGAGEQRSIIKRLPCADAKQLYREEDMKFYSYIVVNL